MKKISCFLVFSILFLGSLSLKAAVPDMGDNSIFRCVEQEDDLEPGQCFGIISWVSDANGNDKADKPLRLKKARKIIRKISKTFKKRYKKANKKGDEEGALSYKAMFENAKATRDSLRACHVDFFEACGDGSGDGDGDGDGGNSDANFPSLTEACNLVSSPTTYGEIQRKRIVNGKVCSDNAAATSPVMRIMLDGAQHCTGAYVAANTILTAAHCLENVTCENLSIENSTGSQIIGASECLSHPQYNQGSEPQANDFAIIKLPNDFDGITPVKVATTNAEVGADAAFAGYGRNENDDTKLRATFNQISDVTTAVISTFYTRGDTNEGTTCNGDSGGPLFVFLDGEWKTHGTLSDGSAADCALAGTNPNSDKSNWANLVDPSNQSFIKDNTDGVLD